MDAHLPDGSDTPVGGSAPAGVAWGRVALFYAIAFGMVSLLGVFFALRHVDFANGASSGIYQLALAFLYMPMPLVAGLVVERVAGRPALLRQTWARFRGQWKRIIGASAASAVAIYTLNLTLTLLLGNVLGVPGVGRLVFTAEAVKDNLAQILPAQTIAQMGAFPPIALLYVLAIVGGLVAGFSINGLFAFGEEYGWRGVLADELRPLGALRASLLTGLLWGLWHAPVILLGFNYGAYRVAGVFMMCAWVVPLSVLMWRLRQYTDSVLPAAIVHGAFNGSAGFFLFFVAQRHPLVAAPVGITGAVAIAVVAAAVWRLTRHGVAEQAARPGSFAADDGRGPSASRAGEARAGGAPG